MGRIGADDGRYRSPETRFHAIRAPKPRNLREKITDWENLGFLGSEWWHKKGSNFEPVSVSRLFGRCILDHLGIELGGRKFEPVSRTTRTSLRECASAILGNGFVWLETKLILAANLQAQMHTQVEQRPSKRAALRASAGKVATISSVYGNNLTSNFNRIVNGG